jgi:hypothetical protein
MHMIYHTKMLYSLLLVVIELVTGVGIGVETFWKLEPDPNSFGSATLLMNV